MHYFTKKLHFFSLLLFSFPLFAMNVNNMCPTVATIKLSTHFSKAIPTPYSSVWALTSDNFHDKGKYWVVAMGVVLPATDSKDEAVMHGQQYFDTQVVLNEPIQTNEREHLICIYSKNKSPYYVIAITPPTHVFGQVINTSMIK